MNKTRIQIAKPDIVKFFREQPKPIFKSSDLARILTQERPYWRLAQSTTTNEFIKFLLDHAELKKLSFPFPYRSEIRYTWGEIPLLEVLMTIKTDSYFSHYTAMRMHGLTEQIPKTIYLNHEQPARPQDSHLQQGRIDAAFKRQPRVSNNVIDFGEVRICMVNGMQTNQMGVVSTSLPYDTDQPVNVRVTNIERTLIDIAVRPTYSGGVFEVLKAYRLAQEQGSVNALTAMLGRLRYVYPYHQAIGFYMERAGYPPPLLDLLRQFPMDFDFYLTHAMGETEYVKQWRLHIPKGL